MHANRVCCRTFPAVCVSTKNYKSWLSVDKVIVIIKKGDIFLDDSVGLYDIWDAWLKALPVLCVLVMSSDYIQLLPSRLFQNHSAVKQAVTVIKTCKWQLAIHIDLACTDSVSVVCNAVKICMRIVLILQQQQQQIQKPVLASDDVTGVQLPSTLIVDVMFEPGRLIDACSCEATAYKTANSWPANN